MGTYENCYNIIADVRRDINEYSVSYVQGADEGAFSNEYITQKINLSQKHLYHILFKRIPHEFEKEVPLTAVNSVFTLPADFGSLIWFKDDNGYPVYPIGSKDQYPGGGSRQQYYRRGNTLILDKAGLTRTYTLIYKWKPRAIFSGKATAGGSTTITFPDTASKIVDYYNDMIIENITKDWYDTILDYAADRVATIEAQTAAQDDYFGIVSDLPDEFHHLIAPRATMLVKQSPISQSQVTKSEKDMYAEGLIEALRAFAGQKEDVDPIEIFTDFDSPGYPSGIIAL